MKLHITLLLFILSCFFSVASRAESNVHLTGRITGSIYMQKLEVTVNEKYLNGDLTVYTGTPDKEGYFAFDIEVKEPQLVSIRYNQKRGLLFLQPFDTLYIELNTKLFPREMLFGEKASSANTYLTSYFKAFPPELNQFKLKQYQTGNYWYINTPQMDELMLSNPPAAFKKKMDQRKQDALSRLDYNQENFPGKLSPEFVEFMNTEIIYDWAYHLMLYGVVFKNRHGIPDEFNEFLDEVPLSINTISNYWYCEFLKGYFERLFQKNGGHGIPELEKYKLASQYLNDKALYYFQSEMIAQSFRSSEAMNMVGKYFEFTEQNPYPEFSEKAAMNFDDAIKLSTGSSAPYFNLVSANGSMVNLDQLRGSVIYLNFWASWCRPCISKMENLKSIQPGLEREGVKFVNISLDKNKETWANTLNRYNFNTGIHLFAGTEISEGVASDYGVKILPQYYILNKDGAFASRPKKKDIMAIQQKLDQLNRQN